MGWVALCVVAIGCAAGNDLARAESNSRSEATGSDASSLDWGVCTGPASATGTLECATLAVPLDHDDPDGEQIELALARSRAAGDPSERIGSLVMNPGGPGGSGIEFLTSAAFVMPEEISSRFDLVSWDPRGVGQSSPVRCLDDEEKESQLEGDISPDTPKEERRAAEDQAELRAGCEGRNPEMIRHMSTADVAEDLEQIRIALGEEQLDYMGFSYGTAIGATYATLYGERVRSMVLDGAVSPTDSDLETAVTNAESFERSYEDFVAECDDDDTCPLGPDAEEALEEIRADLDRRPLEVDTTSGTRELTRDLLDYATLAALYDPTLWRTTARAIADLDDGGAQVILALVDQQTGRQPDGSWDNSTDALAMVNCADSPERPTAADALDEAEEIADASRTFGGLLAPSMLACVDWPMAENPVPEWSSESAPPILVVGTLGDPATPIEWAEQMADTLEGSVLLTYEGDGHTAFLSGGECVQDSVAAYLVDLDVPEEGTSCPSVSAGAPETGGGNGLLDELAQQLEGMGLPTEVAMCVRDGLVEEFGELGLEELLLGGDVLGQFDTISRIGSECMGGG